MNIDFSKVEFLSDEQIEQRRAEEDKLAQKERMEHAHRYIPTGFRDTDHTRLPAHAVIEVKAWSETPKTCQLNIMLYGASGAGKTRLGWLGLKRRYVLFGIPMLGMGAESFTRRMLNEKHLMQEMVRAPILLLDDIGKERATATSEACLFELVRERMDHSKPTIYTTNYTDNEFAKRFTQHHTGKAIARRLKESCKLVNM